MFNIAFDNVRSNTFMAQYVRVCVVLQGNYGEPGSMLSAGENLYQFAFIKINKIHFVYLKTLKIKIAKLHKLKCQNQIKIELI